MQHFVLTGLILLTLGTARGLDLDDTREQVIAELGKPKSIASRGDREILLYPEGVRLELENGRIVSAQGFTLGEIAPASAEVAGPLKSDSTADPAPSEHMDSSAVEGLQEREYTAITGQSQAELERSFDALVAARDEATHVPAKPPFNVIEWVRSSSHANIGPRKYFGLGF
jgi:hypothetical protein